MAALIFDNDLGKITNVLTFDPGANVLTVAGTQGLLVPTGTTAQRPGSPANGMIRNNSSLVVPELYGNSSWQPPGSVGGRSYNSFFDDFLIDNAAVATPFAKGWTRFLAGTGAAVNGISSVLSAGNNDIGVVQLSTGTTTTGVASAYLAQNCFALGYGTLYGEWRIQIPTLATAGDAFTARIGFKDDATTLGANGAYFFHNATTGLRGTCRNASVATSTVAIMTIVAGTWYTLGILINAAASSVSFNINGVLLDTVTTNIPVNPFGVNMMVQKSAGTASRSLYVDYAQFYYSLTTTR